ncbi:7TM-DISM domain-containing protein [Jiulongibacter sediminis]|uniref:7TM-DISM domain-containing protein n=1 Tax=Jiulongibacter sediminis TaxID=1605367 RepID=UPI0026F08478|nr:7TM-DISM domain-containing protein [Jiulongibacter sediminis]
MRKLLSIISLVCLFSASQAQVLTTENAFAVIEDSIRILPDPQNEFRPDQLLSGELNELFRPFKKELIKGDSPLNWLKFTIRNNRYDEALFYLATDRFDYLDFWIYQQEQWTGPTRAE